MKKNLVIVMILVLLCFSAGLFAQEQIQEEKNDYKKTNSKDGIPITSMTLTEKQNKTIDGISTSYSNKILQLRSELIVKQIELKSLLRDPETSEKKILTMALEIRILNDQRQEMMINYQLEIRKILTPEQIRSWCTLENRPFKRGWR